MNYYEILQVAPHASQEVIKSAHRVLMKTAGHHPDLGGELEVAQAINEAYQVLSDPKQRTAYDRTLKGLPRQHQPYSPSPITRVETVFIVFCPACGKQNRVHNEKNLDQARCGHCHKKLSPRKGARMGNLDSTQKMGMFLFEKGLMDRAQKEFQTAVRDNPQDAHSRYWLARTYYERHFYEKALLEMKAAQALRPQAFQFRFWLGQIHFAAKDYSHAADGFRQALAVRPHHGAALRRLGSCYFHLKDYAQAAQAFEQALQADQADASSYRWLGLVHLSTQKTNQAEEAFSQALRLNPKDETTRRYLAMLRPGM